MFLRRRLRLALLAVPVLGLPAATANADTIYVCWDGSGDYLTIQEGIDAAVNGDEVVVCDGTYTGPGNRDLDFGGKAITVRSANGPQTCIIDCGAGHRGFYFHNGETAAAVLDGFTVTNGSTADRGGGVYCLQSSPTVINCIFSENSSEYGGGMAITGGTPTVANCTFRGNSAAYYGGGMRNSQCSPTVINCTFSGNWAAGGGGGMANTQAHPTVINCTFSGNSSVDTGGGMRNWYSDPTVTNSIFWANTDPQIDALGDSNPVVTYSCVQDWPGAGSDGNIDQDPLFVDPDGPDDDPNTWQDNDYHLGTGSPCIDTGDPAFVPTPDERDIDGQMRLWDGDEDGECVVDMGSDEFASIIPGDLNGDGCVNHPDLGILLGAWQNSDEGDLDCDGDTDHSDLGILLTHWGAGCP